jgi:hypothetical protein
MLDMIKLFISYAHEDAKPAKQLVTVLKKFDVPHFIDSDVDTGRNFNEAIEEALKSATHVVVLVSKKSLQSQWVHEEIRRAKAAKKRVFPILLGDGVDMGPTFDREVNYLRLNPELIDGDQLARDLVEYLFAPDGVVPYRLSNTMASGCRRRSSLLSF